MKEEYPIRRLRRTTRPFNIWLTAKCRRYVDPDEPEDSEALDDAEVEVHGDYDGNPTGA